MFLRLRKIGLRIVAGLCVGLLTARAAVTLYDTPTGGFSLVPPAGWMIKQEAGEEYPTLSGPADDLTAPYVVVKEVKGEKDLYSLGDATLKEMLKDARAELFQIRTHDGPIARDWLDKVRKILQTPEGVRIDDWAASVMGENKLLKAQSTVQPAWKLPQRGDKVRCIAQPGPEWHGWDHIKVNQVVEVVALTCVLPTGGARWPEDGEAGIMWGKNTAESPTYCIPIRFFEPAT
jgi:hypothetical protein